MNGMLWANPNIVGLISYFICKFQYILRWFVEAVGILFSSFVLSIFFPNLSKFHVFLRRNKQKHYRQTTDSIKWRHIILAHQKKRAAHTLFTNAFKDLLLQSILFVCVFFYFALTRGEKTTWCVHIQMNCSLFVFICSPFFHAYGHRMVRVRARFHSFVREFMSSRVHSFNAF